MNHRLLANVAFGLCILYSGAVQAATIRLLQANLFSWNSMDPAKRPPPIVALTRYINDNQHDFITTQENDYLLTASIYQLSGNYKLAGQRQDASIFYDSTRWEPAGQPWTQIAMTPDGGGQRVAVFGQFQNKASRELVTIATTHLCIAWGGHADCSGGQYAAHVADAKKISDFLNGYATASTPVILTGDFNNFDNNANQSQAMANALANTGLVPVRSNGNFIGPTFGSATIDFVYSKNLSLQRASLYTAPQGNPSDHAAIDATFTTQSPAPGCPSPQDAQVSKYFDAQKGITLQINMPSGTLAVQATNWLDQASANIGVSYRSANQATVTDTSVHTAGTYAYTLRYACNGSTSAPNKISVNTATASH